jgi:regulator of replication initiation timing
MPNNAQWIKYGLNLAAPRNFSFEQRKIIVRQTSDIIIAAVDYEGFLNFNNVHNIVLKSTEKLSYETLATILNSSLMDIYYTYLVPEKGRVFAEVKGVNLRKLPIKIPTAEQNQTLTELYNQISSLKKQLNTLIIEFKSYLNTVLNVIKIPSKLDAPQNMSFDELKTVLEKSKVDMKDISVFRSVKQMHDEMVALQSEIDKLDGDIGKAVGGLYGVKNTYFEK